LIEDYDQESGNSGDSDNPEAEDINTTTEALDTSAQAMNASSG